MTTLTTEAGPFTCGGCGKPVTRETPENGWRDADGEQYCYEGEQHAPVTEADRFPLTCGWCRNSPATHLVITDVKAAGKQSADRYEEKVCATCAHQTTVLPPEFVGYWLYELVPALPGDAPTLAVKTPAAPWNLPFILRADDETWTLGDSDGRTVVIARRGADVFVVDSGGALRFEGVKRDLFARCFDAAAPAAGTENGQ